MAEQEQHKARELPSDFEQVPTVWRYEMLRYLRSRRIVASLAIVGLVVALIFIIPILTNNPYSGTERNVPVEVIPAGVVSGLPVQIVGHNLPQDIGFVNRTGIVANTLQIFLNGTAYPAVDPSDSSQNWALTKLDYQGQSANLIFFYKNISGDTLTATYEWRTSTTEFAMRFVSFANFLVIICATFFAADSISGEYHLRTGYLLFPNPVKRATLFTGKFLASVTSGVIVIGLFYVVVSALSLVAIRGVDGGILLSMGFAVEYLIAAMAVAYLVSSLLKGTVGPLVLTFFLFLLILPIIDSVGAISGFKSSFSLTFSGGTMQYILQSPYPKDSVTAIPGAGITLHSYFPDPATAAFVMFAYFIVAVLLSVFIFRRKQLLG